MAWTDWIPGMYTDPTTGQTAAGTQPGGIVPQAQGAKYMYSPPAPQAPPAQPSFSPGGFTDPMAQAPNTPQPQPSPVNTQGAKYQYGATGPIGPQLPPQAAALRQGASQGSMVAPSQAGMNRFFPQQSNDQTGSVPGAPPLPHVNMGSNDGGTNTQVGQSLDPATASLMNNAGSGNMPTNAGNGYQNFMGGIVGQNRPGGTPQGGMNFSPNSILGGIFGANKGQGQAQSKTSPGLMQKFISMFGANGSMGNQGVMNSGGLSAQDKIDNAYQDGIDDAND